MEISILFTILFIITSLGGLFLQRGKICLVTGEQMEASLTIKYNLKNGLPIWAVKFVEGEVYLLNIVALIVDLKATHTTLIQPQNLKFEG